MAFEVLFDWFRASNTTFLHYFVFLGLFWVKFYLQSNAMLLWRASMIT